MLPIPPGRTIVAVDEGGEIRASAQLQPNYGPASRVANASFIVDPDFAGRGIGRQLVAHVLDAFEHPTRGLVGVLVMHKRL